MKGTRMAKRYHGKVCYRCGGTERYASNNHCCHCNGSAEINKRRPGYRNAKESARRKTGTAAPIAKHYANETRQIYIDAALKTQLEGRLYTVDHVVPLHHELVCGLHVPANLQIMTSEDNTRKSNTYDPSTWKMPLFNPYLFMQ